MNIKLEIDNQKFEMAIIDYSLSEYDDWGYEIFDVTNGLPVAIGDENDYGDMFQAATSALHHLLSVLTNDNHGIED